MMSTTLRTGVIAATLAVAALCAFRTSQAQTGPEGDSAQTEQEGTAKLPRPKSNLMQQVPEIDERMLRVLQLWENHTAKINRLHVKHQRRVYDAINFVERVSEGELYFDAPDRGRINIRPVTPAKGEKSKRKDPKTDEPYLMEADVAEQWICDGNFVYQVNEEEKTVDEVPLPKEVKGTKIMDGPMPFLFGMPVDQARKRYNLKFSEDRPDNRPRNEIWLDVKPRLEQDAQAWSSAKLILDSKTFLPLFVKMIDPIGNLETVYTFTEPQVNPLVPPWKGIYTPPKGKGWTVNRNQKQIANGPPCPSLIGLSAQNAKDVLEKSGYQVGWVQGDPATKQELVFVVYEQFPLPHTPVQKGQKITLKVWDKIVVNNGKPVGPAPEKSANNRIRPKTATK